MSNDENSRLAEIQRQYELVLTDNNWDLEDLAKVFSWWKLFEDIDREGIPLKCFPDMIVVNKWSNEINLMARRTVLEKVELGRRIFGISRGGLVLSSRVSVGSDSQVIDDDGVISEFCNGYLHTHVDHPGNREFSLMDYFAALNSDIEVVICGKKVMMLVRTDETCDEVDFYEIVEKVQKIMGLEKNELINHIRNNTSLDGVDCSRLLLVMKLVIPALMGMVLYEGDAKLLNKVGRFQLEEIAKRIFQDPEVIIHSDCIGVRREDLNEDE